MKEVKTSKKAELLATAISLVLTLAAGVGLSILLDGFVQGFLALGVLSIGLIVYLVRRNYISIEL